MITVRPASAADVTMLHLLQSRWDEQWFGAPESDADEFAEEFAHVPSGQAVVAEDDGAPVGAAWWWATTGVLSVDPTIDPAVTDPADVRSALLDHAESIGMPLVQALERDTATRDALAARGWRHDHSSFELIRTVDDGWTIDEPRWPADVALRPFADADPQTVYDLVYRDAAWTEVPGHVQRPFEQWHGLFVAPSPPERMVLAERDGRLAGVAITRLFADDTGWVAQLAVARDARGLGLGRALLLEALRRLRDAGAVRLGLGVEAENAGALRLYLGVGLALEREWQTWTRG